MLTTYLVTDTLKIRDIVLQTNRLHLPDIFFLNHFNEPDTQLVQNKLPPKEILQGPTKLSL